MIPLFMRYKVRDIDSNYKSTDLNKDLYEKISQESYNLPISNSQYLLGLISEEHKFNLEYCEKQNIVPEKIKLLLSILPKDIVNIIGEYLYIRYTSRQHAIE